MFKHDEKQITDFSNEVAIEFLNTGDVAGLEGLLAYLSENQCVNII